MAIKGLRVRMPILVYALRTTRMKRPRFGMPNLFYAHPFELALGFVLVLSGARTVLTGLSSPTVSQLSETSFYALTVLGLVGGIGILVGLLVRAKAIGRTIERAGLLLSAGAYFGYAIVLGFSDFPLSATWDIMSRTAGVALACVVRERAVRKTEKIILAALKEANNNEDLILNLVDTRGALKKTRDDEETS